jgi:hypothetical protein
MNIDEEIQYEENKIVKLQQQKTDLERKKELFKKDYCYKRDDTYSRIILEFDNNSNYGKRFLVETVSFQKQSSYSKSSSDIKSCLSLEWKHDITYEKWLGDGVEIDIKDFYLIKLQIIESLKAQAGGDFAINIVPKLQTTSIKNQVLQNKEVHI